jgi:hypothetical protein
VAIGRPYYVINKPDSDCMTIEIIVHLHFYFNMWVVLDKATHLSVYGGVAM